jgi:uncharacterized membrane protein
MLTMEMPVSRKIIAEFIGVFLIGGVAGGLLMWCYTDTQLSSFMTRTNDPDSLVARIDKKYSDEYHLTPDEMTRIQPLITEMAQHIYQVRHQFGVDILSTFDDYHTKIAEQLTPEHREAYQQANDARKKKLSLLLLPDPASPTQGQK